MPSTSIQRPSPYTTQSTSTRFTATLRQIVPKINVFIPLFSHLNLLIFLRPAHHSLSPDPISSSASSDSSLALLPTPSPPRSFQPPLVNPAVTQGEYWAPSSAAHVHNSNQWPSAVANSNKRSWDWEEDTSPAQRQMDQFLNDLKKRKVDPNYDSRMTLSSLLRSSY